MLTYQINVYENSGVILMARIKDDSGNVLSPYDIESITLKVFSVNADEQVGETLELDPSTTMFSTLQTDSKWKEDDEGYCFAYALSGDYFPSGDTSYRIEAKFQPLAQDAEYGFVANSFYVAWDAYAEKIYSE